MNVAAWPFRGGAAWRGVFFLPSLLYGAAVRLRSSAYAAGFLETVRAGVPVFCVGNMTTGGTGKTPVVIWLASFLRQKGRRPAVLSRGYGRRSKGNVIVSRGQGPLATVQDSGDEPFLIASLVDGLAVLVGSRRV
ncbi:MAG TPA: tetraacyldisaccharide 4'-kinase, partial [Elusimicrobiota bacterium]|nr:tetraacyldisaccharide 4'-kinase [Elusimicrobiota bacterium]